MKKMLLSDFEQFCGQLKKVSYVFDSSNQDSLNTGLYMYFVTSFDSVKVYHRPDCVCFMSKGGANIMRIGRVRYISVIDDTPEIGIIIQIVCGPDTEGVDSITYTFVIDKK